MERRIYQTSKTRSVSRGEPKGPAWAKRGGRGEGCRQAPKKKPEKKNFIRKPLG